MELTLVDHEINRIMDLEVATQESKAKEGELRAYRRALRDYPQQAEFPNCQRPSID
ncbi:hypothetical protein JCM19237_348 [Photobacterium aphoticum]|uniref:Phage tail assembly chaperone-like domain-containing protein n=1 Tax=Photobacterium aphoticum TaxID=754436 RepID=A0A090R0E0_9GAMM|nr:hypothetical protein JCM19237_348 [Photobacterium aphoticum]